MINFLKQLLDWIYCRKCYFCKKPSGAALMCQNCYEEIEFNGYFPVRTIAGVPVYSASKYSNNVKTLIRGLKYHNKKELAEPLAKIIYEIWKNTEESREEYEIIPMPLHNKRQKQRGFNHMNLVAKEFSKLTGYSVNNEIATRIKNTVPLYKLPRKERLINLQEAFSVNPDKYNGKKLLLIDDISTTGATLEELINTFKKHNINNLCAIVGASSVQSQY